MTSIDLDGAALLRALQHTDPGAREGRVITHVPWRVLDCRRMTRSPELADFVAR